MEEARVDGALIVQPINHKFDHSLVTRSHLFFFIPQVMLLWFRKLMKQYASLISFYLWFDLSGCLFWWSVDDHGMPNTLLVLCFVTNSPVILDLCLFLFHNEFCFIFDSVLKKYPSKFVGCCLANPAEDGSGIKELESLVLEVFPLALSQKAYHISLSF